MNDAKPHYLLTTTTNYGDTAGSWRFVLRQLDGHGIIEVADVEPDVFGERLDLLTVVRALEWLDQPSRVTLVGCTRYVEQGIRFGIAEWRENGWQWESFGQMSPIRDIDLWQRMDRVLQFHQVECGQRRLESGHTSLAGPHWNISGSKQPTTRINSENWIKYCAAHAAVYRVYLKSFTSGLWQFLTGQRRARANFSHAG